LDKVLFHPNYDNDVAVIVDVRGHALVGNAMSVDYILNYPSIADAAFINSMEVCDFVAFPGFPEWFDRESYRPILRVGTVASDPRYDYTNQQARGNCIAYEAFSFGGSSGSPVFALQKGFKMAAPLTFEGFRESKLVGINAGHLVETEYRSHSGISYFYKATAILDLIDCTSPNS
jgi:hypothetical protein